MSQYARTLEQQRGFVIRAIAGPEGDVGWAKAKALGEAVDLDCHKAYELDRCFKHHVTGGLRPRKLGGIFMPEVRVGSATDTKPARGRSPPVLCRFEAPGARADRGPRPERAHGSHL